MQLSTQQITEVLTTLGHSEDGYNTILKIAFEAMMMAERSAHNQERSDLSNGYRRRKAFGHGKALELRVPRSRSGQFYPMLLGLLRNQEEESRQMAFELYGAGLTTTQVGDLFEKFYGQGYSKSSVSRMFEDARGEVKAWLDRPLERYYPVLYIDATFIATRRGEGVSKEAYYTILGIKADRTREVVCIVNTPTESAAGWAEALAGLRQRGVEEVDLVVSDGLAAIEDAVAGVWGGVSHQLCAIHLQRGSINKVKPADKGAVAAGLKEVFVTGDPGDSPAKGWERFGRFCAQWKGKYPSIGRMAANERYRHYFTYLQYDYRVRPMLYSTNWIERLNRDYKRTTRMRGALPDSNATLLLLGHVAMTRKAYWRKVPKLDYEQQFRWESETGSALPT